MNKLDDMIKEALEGEDKDIFEQTQEQGYFALALGVFAGKTGWVSWVIMVVQVVLALLSIWCILEFFKAQDVLVALKWGLPGATLFLMAGALKLSLVPVMQGDRIVRELKRIELMLVRSKD